MLSLPAPIIESRSLRYSSAIASGLLMTAAIFILMYELIGTGPVERVENPFFNNINIYEAPPENMPEPEIEPEPELQNTPVVEPDMAPLMINSPSPSNTLKVAGPPIGSFEPTLGDISLPSGDGSLFGSGLMSGNDSETWTPPGDDALAKKIAEADAKGKAGYREVLPRATRQPNIPEYAWKNKVDGWVLVAFTVNALGNVENVRVLDAHPKGVFEENVIASVKHWVYSPADIGGKKVKVQLTQKIELFWKDYPNNNKQLK